MSTSVEELVSAAFDELKLSQRFIPYAAQAEAAGYPQLAKLFRALTASETAREQLLRQGLVRKASLSGDYYVCPHCGLIYDGEPPECCLADETPGAEFTVVR